MWGVWAERAGVEAAAAEKGWDVGDATPLVSEVCDWVLTFCFLWFALLASAMSTPLVCCGFIWFWLWGL